MPLSSSVTEQPWPPRMQGADVELKAMCPAQGSSLLTMPIRAGIRKTCRSRGLCYIVPWRVIRVFRVLDRRALVIDLVVGSAGWSVARRALSCPSSQPRQIYPELSASDQSALTADQLVFDDCMLSVSLVVS
jgi:hypothetical protein